MKKKLGKKNELTDLSIEAYACSCKSCNCSVICYCGPGVERNEGAVNGQIKNGNRNHTGSTSSKNYQK